MLGGGGGSDDDDGKDETDDSDLDEPGWRITRKMMDHVDSSDWLRSDLGDGGLRCTIFDIDEANLEASRSSGGGGRDGGRRFSNIMHRRPLSPRSDLSQSDESTRYIISRVMRHLGSSRSELSVSSLPSLSSDPPPPPSMLPDS